MTEHEHERRINHSSFMTIMYLTGCNQSLALLATNMYCLNMGLYDFSGFTVAILIANLILKKFVFS